MLEWLLLEIIGFYCYVISGSIYLGMLSCCGGSHDANERKEKRKYDAIEYYKNDIDWFIYIFVFLGLNLTSITYEKDMIENLPLPTIFTNVVSVNVKDVTTHLEPI